MTISFEKTIGKIAQVVLCLLVGTISGGILLLDLPLKWELAFFGLMGIAVSMVLVRNPKGIILLILAFTVPFYSSKGIINSQIPLSLSTGIGIGVIDVLVLMLLILFSAKLSQHQAEFEIPALIPPALIWIVLSSLSILSAVYSQAVIFQLIFMAKMLLLSWVVGISVKNDLDISFLITGLLLGIVFQSLIGTLQGITGQSLGLSFLTEAAEVGKQQVRGVFVSRVQGTLGHPNTLAMYLSTGVPFAFVLLFTSVRRSVKVLAVLSLCLIISGLVFSLSRAAWGTLVITIFLVLLFAIKRKRINSLMAIAIVCLIALILVGVTLSGTDLILARLTSSDNGSAMSRISLAKSALRIIADNPLIGIGLNNYSLVSPHYDPVDLAAWGNKAPVVHNVFLLIAAETGFLGLAAFVVFLIILLIQSWRIVIKAPSEMVWVAGVGIGGALAALVIHSMVDYALLGSGQLFTQFWLLVGLISALVKRIDDRKLNTLAK